MPFYALIKNQQVIEYPYSIDKLKKDNPKISFPSPISEAVLNAYDVKEVIAVNAPSINTHVQKIESNGIEFNSNTNTWVTSWNVVNLSQQEIQEKEFNTANYMREVRNDLLKGSDWTQLPDSSANTELWAEYRQQLRDIPQQAGFPLSINWPDLPQ